MATSSQGNFGGMKGSTSGQTREQLEEAKGHMKEAEGHAKQAVTGAASEVAQKAHDLASEVAQQARGVASNVAQRAHDAATSAAEKTDETISTMGNRISSIAGSLRETAPREGMLGSAAGAVADRLDAGGQYLQSHGLGEMGEDLATVIRRHPLPAILAAFGVGLFLGMSSRR